MKKLLSDIVRILSWQLAIVIILIGLVAVAYICRKPILIAYHRWGQESSLKAMSRRAKEFPSIEYERLDDRFSKHQNALVDLGYLQKRTFDTKYLNPNSPEGEKLFLEFIKECSQSSYSVSWSPGLTIIDRPERMATWEALVKKYDVPPDEPNQTDTSM